MPVYAEGQQNPIAPFAMPNPESLPVRASDAQRHGPTLSQWADRIEAVNRAAGWYDKPVPEGDMAALLHSEVSEFYEAYREGRLMSPCDKADKMIAAGIAPLTCAEEELADVMIRCLDYCRRLGIDPEKAVGEKLRFNATRAYRHGGKVT